MTKLRLFPVKFGSYLRSILGVLVLCAAPSLLSRADPQNASPQELLSQADEVLQQMSQITGLPINGPLKKQGSSRVEMEKVLAVILHVEVTQEENCTQEGLLHAYGLLSIDNNLQKFRLS